MALLMNMAPHSEDMSPPTQQTNQLSHTSTTVHQSSIDGRGVVENMSRSEAPSGRDETVKTVTEQTPAPTRSEPDVEPSVESPEPVRREGLRQRKTVDYKALARGLWMKVQRVSVKTALKAADGDIAAAAIAAELEGLYREHQAFEPVLIDGLSRQEKTNIIRGHCFLKDKYKPDGTFDKKKARYVMGGDQQRPDTYDETTSPTVNPLSLMIMINIAAAGNKFCTTGDVPTAFLRSDMPEGDPVLHAELDPTMTEIMLDMFPELKKFVTPRGSLIMKLKKYVYGLKQASHKFFKHMEKFFLDLGFVATKCDSCVFVRRFEAGDITGSLGGQITCAIHVDDIFSVSDDQPMMDWMRGKLLKSLGVVCEPGNPDKLSFLGMTVEFDRALSEARISMLGYTESLLERFGGDLKMADTPATAGLFDGPIGEEVEAGKFASLLMTLMYLARFTRPDILLAVSALATRMRSPTDGDWTKVKRILKYLKATPQLGVRYKAEDGGPVLRFYVDASHAVYPDGKGQGAIIITLGSGPVLAKTWKLKHVCLSSTEAEVSALSEAGTYVVWTREFMRELGYEQKLPTVIFEDNQSSIKMSIKGGGTFKRSKHLVVRGEFVNELVESGALALQYCPTEDMVADMLTKPLDKARLRHLLELAYMG